ncbi:hypothetical protein MKX03_013377 [Papaver bracteatum]|nr:hypothetical protein MKX03_013377 [Papaver bracteatum]
MSNKVGHEGAQPNQPSSPTSAQDLNQHRRQREEEMDSNQSNQRRNIENIERLRDQFYRQWDMWMEEDAIHDSDDDDDDDETVEEESLDSDEGWNSDSQDDQYQQGTSVPVVGHYQIYNEDGSVRTTRFFSGTLSLLNSNVGSSEDGLSYEELTELQERAGKVQRGVPKETISRELKTRVNTSSEEETEICTVCQDGYEKKDKIATLDCKHEYHQDCITQWLLQKNVCPVCKRQALMMEESKGEEVNEC